MKITGDVISRFDSMHMPEPNSGCWLWLGNVARPSKPYGRFTVNRKSLGAHRFSYELAHGQSPGEMFVCHKCDNPSCVNPDHLYLGDHTQNMADRKRKGREAKGPNAAVAKFTAEQVQEIRSCPLGNTETAKLYGVNRTTIRRLRVGITYGSV